MNKLMSEVLFNRAVLWLLAALVAVAGKLDVWMAWAFAAAAMANAIKSLRVWAGDAE